MTKRTVKQTAWQVETSSATVEGRRDLMQQLGRNEIEITDENGEPLPTYQVKETCDIAALPPIDVFDRNGQLIAKAGPKQTPVERRQLNININDRNGFLFQIKDYPYAEKKNLIESFDECRRDQGIEG